MAFFGATCSELFQINKIWSGLYFSYRIGSVYQFPGFFFRIIKIFFQLRFGIYSQVNVCIQRVVRIEIDGIKTE